MVNVLYEDNHVIVVEKSANVPIQADRENDPSLLEEVKQFIKIRDQKPGNVFLGLVHRLDRPVGGVVLFAKTSKGASRLSQQFRERTIEKNYYALVEGEPAKKAGTVDQWLLKNREENIVSVVPPTTPQAKRAELTYEVLKPVMYKGTLCSLVSIWPKTGRPHQIRVAMKSLGTPILGDAKYGSVTRFSPGIALWAHSLTFLQPVTKEPITVTSQPDWKGV